MSQTKAQLISDLVQALNFTGTASAPANGLFLSEANKLAFATASTERLKLAGSEVVVNETGTDTDFRVEGDTNINLLFCDAGNDRVGIGINNPATALSVGGVIKSNVDANSGTSTAIRTENGGTGTTIASYGFASGNSQKASIRAHVLGNGAMMFHNNNDTEKMRIDASGNVGIGTSSPDVNFHVSNTSSVAKIESTASATSARLIIKSANNTYTGLHFGDDADDDVGRIRYYHTNNHMHFSTGASERMRIDSAGRVLVGTTDTPSKLVVDTDFCVVRSSSDPTINLLLGSSSSITQLYRILIDDSDSDKLQVRSGDTPRITMTTGGAVGIGTTSPSSNLHIASSLATIRLEDSDVANGASYSLITSSSNGNIELSADPDNVRSSSDIRFNVDGSEKMRIDSSGNVGIGTTNPSDFHSSGENLVVGSGSGEEGMTIYSGNSSNGVINFADSTSGSDSYEGRIVYSHDVNRMTFHVADGSERMRIDNNGRYYFNTSSQGAHGGFYNVDGSNSSLNALNVKGTTANYVMISSAGGSTGDHIFFSNYTSSNPGTNTGRIKDDGSNVTYHTTSDYRLKENVVAISDGINRVKQLNPIRHTWINNPTPGTIDGWLAHELDEVCPYAVDGEKDATNPDGSINPQGVDYGRITPLLTAALKEAIAKIETLETKVAALEAA